MSCFMDADKLKFVCISQIENEINCIESGAM